MTGPPLDAAADERVRHVHRLQQLSGDRHRRGTGAGAMGLQRVGPLLVAAGPLLPAVCLLRRAALLLRTALARIALVRAALPALVSDTSISKSKSGRVTGRFLLRFQIRSRV